MAEVIDFKDDAHRKAVQLTTLFRALVLEGKTGMKMSSRGSALSTAKKLGFAGDRTRILHQVHYTILDLVIPITLLLLNMT